MSVSLLLLSIPAVAGWHHSPFLKQRAGSDGQLAGQLGVDPNLV